MRLSSLHRAVVANKNGMRLAGRTRKNKEGALAEPRRRRGSEGEECCGL